MKKITEVEKKELEKRIERFVQQFVTFGAIPSTYEEVKIISSSETIDDSNGRHGSTLATLTVKKYCWSEEPMILNISLKWDNECACFYEYTILSKYPREAK